jgi:hypothetical protein
METFRRMGAIPIASTVHPKPMLKISVHDDDLKPAMFYVMIDDQEQVDELCRQFNQLERYTFVENEIRTGYRYSFTFWNERYQEMYKGYTYSPQWLVRESRLNSKSNVSYPRAILQNLHESIGLPIWTDPETNMPLI